MEKKVRKFEIGKYSEINENLAFWLARKPSERVAAVEQLRRQRHGNTGRLQRTITVIQRASR